MASVLKNSKNPSRICFHIFTRDKKTVNIELLTRLVKKFHATVELDEILPQLFRDLPQIEYKTIDAYSRIFAPRLLEGRNYHRLIYLDTDMMVRKDLVELAEVQLNGHSLGAVRDDYYEIAEGYGPLFNSGVMVIDLKRWYERRIEEQVLQQIRHGETGKMLLADQDDLNRVLAKDWQVINPKWNAMTGDLMSGKVQYKESYIIHFNGNSSHKPDYLWNDHPGKKEYFDYLRIGLSKNLPIFYVPIWMIHVIRVFFRIQ